jgi:hypothetical protein
VQGTSLDEKTFNLVSIKDISMIDRGVKCDFIGIVLRIGKTIGFVNKRNENVSRVNL